MPGDSDKPAAAPLDIAAQAGTCELLRHLGVDRFGVVGAASGGGVAQLLALGEAGDVGEAGIDVGEAGVEAMVLLNPIVDGDRPSESTRAIQESPPEQRRAAVAAVIRTAFDLGMGHRSRLADAQVDEYVRPYRGPDGMRAFFRAAEALDGEGLRDRDAELGRLDIPVLILWGEDDPFLPVVAAERLNEWMPSSTLGLLPGCGHFLLEDAIDTIGPMIYEYLRARMFLKAPHGHADDPSGAVMIQLERRPPWVDLAEYDDEDDDEEEVDT